MTENNDIKELQKYWSFFDETVDKKGNLSLKFDMAEMIFGQEASNSLLLWVATCDWGSPPFVIKALEKKLSESPILPYTMHGKPYRSIVKKWMKDRFNWIIEEDDICFSPGIVVGLTICVQSFSHVGDSVFILEPVYYPFMDILKNNERKIISCELKLKNERFEIDFEKVESLFKIHRPKIWMFCNPHNPVGTLFGVDVLRKVAQLCEKYNVVLLSDEIYNCLTMPSYDTSIDSLINWKDMKQGKPKTFVPMATVDDGSFQHITVTLTSVSKTFNLAGVAESQIIITNPILKKLYEIGRGRAALWGPNWSGPLATRAAYSDEGHKWVDALCIYLLNNAQLVRAACAFGSVDVADRCKENATFPLGIKPIPIEATFLMWLDARQLTKWIVQYEPTPEHVDNHTTTEAAKPEQRFENFDRRIDEELVARIPDSYKNSTHQSKSRLVQFFIDQCDVALEDGEWFGQGGEGFVRLNLGSPRATVEQAMQRIITGITKFKTKHNIE